jgi:hypothetical protein
MKGRNGTEVFLTFKARILIYGLAPSKDLVWNLNFRRLSFSLQAAGSNNK